MVQQLVDAKTMGDERRYKILLIDDDSEDAKIVQRLLQRSTHTIELLEIAANGDKAIEACEKTDFDVILLDYYLGIETAYEFIHRMPIHMEKPAMVILTGKDEGETDESSLGLGVESFLYKNDLKTNYLWRSIRYAVRNKELQNRLSDFANILAHDMNSPAANISGLLELVEQCTQEGDTKEALDLIASAKKEAKRLTVTVEGLKQYCESKTGEICIEKTDLNYVASEAKSMIANELAKDRAEVNVSELPHCSGDSRLLIHLFKNLIQNGIKYNNSQKPTIDVSAAPIGNDWLISIADNGIGIDPKGIEKVFRPMVRLKRHKRASGTGLGLAICKEIIERHGGRIWIESEGEGHGSTFKFTLSPYVESSDAKRNPLVRDADISNYIKSIP